MDQLNLSGLIPILGGIYGLLMAHRIVPRNPKHPEKLELWHRKFGRLMKIICPIVIGFGFLELFRLV